jgi:hypothetical protein
MFNYRDIIETPAHNHNTRLNNSIGNIISKTKTNFYRFLYNICVL